MPLAFPIDRHLFDPDALKRVIADTIPQLRDGRTGAIVATTDLRGVKVALELNQAGGHWSATAAYAHDWNGNDTIGGTVMYSW